VYRKAPLLGCRTGGHARDDFDSIKQTVDPAFTHDLLLRSRRHQGWDWSQISKKRGQLRVLRSTFSAIEDAPQRNHDLGYWIELGVNEGNQGQHRRVLVVARAVHKALRQPPNSSIMVFGVFSAKKSDEDEPSVLLANNLSS
jgi:hypothetical protein